MGSDSALESGATALRQRGATSSPRHAGSNREDDVTIKFARSTHRRYLVAVIAVLTAVGVPHAGSAALQHAASQIVFGSQHGGEDEIWVMNADGTNKHNLTRHDGAKISDIDPRWSPDGRLIAFSSDPGRNRQIWVMNADGTNAHQVTNAPGANRDPSWTADGKAIVFQSLNGGNFEIDRVNADGTGLVDLTNSPSADWSPATSPYGNKIVFTSDRDGNGHLYVLAGDGTLQKITNGPGYDYFADWSPRGNDIAFSRDDAAGQTDLYLVHADGTGERRLTNTPGVAEYYPTFSPDGSQLAYSACTFFPTLVPSLHCSIHVLNLDGTGDTSLAFPPLSLPFPITDDFNNNTRSVDLWSIIHDGTGGFLQWANGRLEMSIAADGAPAPGESNIGAHVGANCLLSGDFDVQVDYQLLTWPPGDGVNVGINAFFTNGSVNRSSQTFGDSYNSFIDPTFNSVPTQDQSGSLRLVRSGTTMTSYYKSGGVWVQLASAPAQQTAAIRGTLVQELRRLRPPSREGRVRQLPPGRHERRLLIDAP
jgi:Tol biopolymer transport system component